MVHIAHLDARCLQVVGQILGHLFGQRCDQHAFAFGGTRVDFADQVVDLPLDRAHHDLRIEQAGWTDNLLDHLPGTGQLIFAGRGGNIDDLVESLVELLEVQRAVVIGRGQAEPVLDQTLLARAVAVIHGAHLRQGDVALVHDEQKILGEIIDQRKRRGTRRTARKHARIVLNTAAKTDLLQHFNVVPRALRNALRLD